MAYTPKLTYKGRPLVRCGNDIYYGSMSDPYIVYLQVLSNRTENGVEIADKVHLVLLSTDDSKPLPERIQRPLLRRHHAAGRFAAEEINKATFVPCHPGIFLPGFFFILIGGVLYGT